MCGIYGSIGFAPDEARIDIVANRGPDGRGWQEFTSPVGPVALGHRRLAIIDVRDVGLQPMVDCSGRFHLVFNGELYNYLELRDELKASGEIFRTETDSEVLLRAYAVWGEAALNRFRGMFAFLIWDEHKKRMFVARDRFGIKPLYMFNGARGVAFASEIKQLLGLPGLSGRMNIARVHDFLASGISDHTAETMFDGVTQLRAGECAVIEMDCTGTIALRLRRWYEIMDPDRRLVLSEDEAAERFRALLTDSVRVHLRSDVPVGSCLSGGLDSSSIVCLMAEMLVAQNSGARVNTVSACYVEKSIDEKPFMDAVVARSGALPHYIFPRADDVFAHASEITWHQDEPFGSTSIFAQWCVFAEAKRVGIKVMLDGQGADEQLAGYHASFAYYLANLMRHGRLLTAARTLRQRSETHGAPISDQVKHMIVALLPSWLAARLRRQRRALAEHDWLASNGENSDNPHGALESARVLLGLPAIKDLATYCYALTFASNLQMLLHWEDRNSMAHSVEARVPFVDHPLVEFSLQLGNDHKIVGSDTKRVLRGAMSNILPPNVRDRRDKLGFATPEQGWFRGPLKQFVRQGIEATLDRYPELFNKKGTRYLAQTMLNGARPVDFTLWRIINLGIWGERFRVLI
jgi:asparagine synthase (glutamine-hydrolysing)